MDVLSDGRVEIGIGAGWMESDYEPPASRTTARRAHRPLRGGARRHQGGDGRRPVLVRRPHYTITDYDGRPSRCSGRTRRS